MENNVSRNGGFTIKSLYKFVNFYFYELPNELDMLTWRQLISKRQTMTSSYLYVIPRSGCCKELYNMLHDHHMAYEIFHKRNDKWTQIFKHNTDTMLEYGIFLFFICLFPLSLSSLPPHCFLSFISHHHQPTAAPLSGHRSNFRSYPHLSTFF
jgi:hypothetical protein